MKANELRIGNYIYFHGDVEEINMVDGCGIIGREEQPLCSIDEFKPIPLTREWLLNFSFQDKYSEKRIYFIIKGLLIEVKNGGKFHYNNIHLKHVHQLQNLYFALTNKELILNI